MATYWIPAMLLRERIDPRISDEQLQRLNAWASATLAQEPGAAVTDVDPGQRGLLTTFIGFYTGKPRNSREEAQAFLPFQRSDPNPVFPIVDTLPREGGRLTVPHDPEGVAEFADVAHPDWLEVRYALAAVMLGGDSDLPVWFAVPDPTAPVPQSWPESTDGGGNPVAWQDWGTQWHPLVDLGGTLYRSSLVGQSGEPIRASYWVPLYLQGQLNVIGLAEYKALQHQQAPQP
ncbi:MAG: hypothetical protein KatS3mg109_0045 [Pirellulaceae bacterium]|nr:MAG: hypothetical protein KatS3mg109_0045 [Pirellulaceae bacterium]